MAELHPFRLGTIPVDDEGRAAFQPLVSLPDRDFDNLIGDTLKALASATSTTDTDAHAALARLPASSAAAAIRRLQAVLVDLAGANTPANSVRSLFEEYGLPTAKAQRLSDAYGSAVSQLRQRLIESGPRLPQLVNLSWRLDYSVASKEGGKTGRPMYRVDLQLRHDDGRASTESFACTPQELEDLRARVKEAVRATQMLAQRLT